MATGQQGREKDPVSGLKYGQGHLSQWHSTRSHARQFRGRLFTATLQARHFTGGCIAKRHCHHHLALPEGLQSAESSMQRRIGCSAPFTQCAQCSVLSAQCSVRTSDPGNATRSKGKIGRFLMEESMIPCRCLCLPRIKLREPDRRGSVCAGRPGCSVSALLPFVPGPHERLSSIRGRRTIIIDYCTAPNSDEPAAVL